MIDLISRDVDIETQRVLAGLDARGFQTRLNADDAQAGNICLVHVAALADQSLAGHDLSNVVAFGGSDRAADAVAVLRQGAVEYLPAGASIDSICQCLHKVMRSQKQTSSAAQPSIHTPTQTPTHTPPACRKEDNDKFKYVSNNDNKCNHNSSVPGRNDSHTDALSNAITDDVAQLCASEAMQRTFALAERVAQADIAVMVSGASGTGKEVVAQFIHQRSPRRDGPFIALNCAAIPETMLEAMLFGHDKGAFTGATENRVGKFELAHKGTLLLDEITEMPVALQAKLLRVLQEKEVERIGGHAPRKVDVRVIATSNRNLRQAVADGVLREDLYYRLSVFPIELPPLAERLADILPLTRFFLNKYSNRDLQVSAEAQGVLLRHNWPGNVRELENCIQRAVVLCDGQVIAAEHLALTADGLNMGGAASMIAAQPGQSVAASNQANAAHNKETLAQQVRSAEEHLLLQTLAANNGVRKVTAVELGISERTLRYKLKQLRDRGVLA